MHYFAASSGRSRPVFSDTQNDPMGETLRLLHANLLPGYLLNWNCIEERTHLDRL